MNRKKLLYIANGFPSPEKSWKCQYNFRAVRDLSNFYSLTICEIKSINNFYKPRKRIYDFLEVWMILVTPKVKNKGINRILRFIDKLFFRIYVRNMIINNDIIFSVSFDQHTSIIQKYCDKYKKAFCIQLIGGEVSRIEKSQYSGSDFLNNVDLIFSVSDSLGYIFTRFFPNLRPITVYRGIDVSKIPNKSSKKTEHNLRFLYLGGYIGDAFYPVDKISQKGSDILLRAWEKFDNIFNGDCFLGLGGPLFDYDFSKEWSARLIHSEAIVHIGTL
jgi:hypothetical protein